MAKPKDDEGWEPIAPAAADGWEPMGDEGWEPIDAAPKPPVKYEERPKMGRAMAAALGGGQSFTGNYADELGSAVAAPAKVILGKLKELTGVGSDDGLYRPDGYKAPSLSEAYGETKRDLKALDAQAQQDRPWEYGSAKLGGTVAKQGLLFGATGGASLTPQAQALLGALEGYGATEADTAAGQLEDTARQSLVNGAFGAGAKYAPGLTALVGGGLGIGNIFNKDLNTADKVESGLGGLLSLLGVVPQVAKQVAKTAETGAAKRAGQGLQEARVEAIDQVEGLKSNLGQKQESLAAKNKGLDSRAERAGTRVQGLEEKIAEAPRQYAERAKAQVQRAEDNVANAKLGDQIAQGKHQARAGAAAEQVKTVQQYRDTRLSQARQKRVEESNRQFHERLDQEDANIGAVRKVEGKIANTDAEIEALGRTLQGRLGRGAQMDYDAYHSMYASQPEDVKVRLKADPTIGPRLRELEAGMEDAASRRFSGPKAEDQYRTEFESDKGKLTARKTELEEAKKDLIKNGLPEVKPSRLVSKERAVEIANELGLDPGDIEKFNHADRKRLLQFRQGKEPEVQVPAADTKLKLAETKAKSLQAPAAEGQLRAQKIAQAERVLTALKNQSKNPGAGAITRLERQLQLAKKAHADLNASAQRGAKPTPAMEELQSRITDAERLATDEGILASGAEKMRTIGASDALTGGGGVVNRAVNVLTRNYFTNAAMAQKDPAVRAAFYGKLAKKLSGVPKMAEYAKVVQLAATSKSGEDLLKKAIEKSPELAQAIVETENKD